MQISKTRWKGTLHADMTVDGTRLLHCTDQTGSSLCHLWNSNWTDTLVPSGHISVSHINGSVPFPVGPWCKSRLSNWTNKIYMMYTDHLGIIITKHWLDNHFYAGDTQLGKQRIWTKLLPGSELKLSTRCTFDNLLEPSDEKNLINNIVLQG